MIWIVTTASHVELLLACPSLWNNEILTILSWKIILLIMSRHVTYGAVQGVLLLGVHEHLLLVLYEVCLGLVQLIDIWVRLISSCLHCKLWIVVLLTTHRLSRVEVLRVTPWVTLTKVSTWHSACLHHRLVLSLRNTKVGRLSWGVHLSLRIQIWKVWTWKHLIIESLTGARQYFLVVVAHLSWIKIELTRALMMMFE